MYVDTEWYGEHVYAFNNWIPGFNGIFDNSTNAYNPYLPGVFLPPPRDRDRRNQFKLLVDV